MESEKNPQPKVVSAARGASWLREGFSFFTQSPLNWFILCFILIVVTILLAVIPLGSLLMTVLQPVVVGALMLGCYMQEEDGKLELSKISQWAPPRAWELVKLGLVYLFTSILASMLVLILVVVMIGDWEALMHLDSDNPEMIAPYINNIILAVLMGALLYVPIVMALWFSPALLVFHDLSITQAMTLSFKACALNVVPFLIYGFVVMFLAVLATLPLTIGWFVLIPVLIAALYKSYRDIFFTTPD